MTSDIDTFDPVLIQMVRKAAPIMMAYDLCGVQPMTLSPEQMKAIFGTRKEWPLWEPYHKYKSNKWYYQIPTSPHVEPWGNFFRMKIGPFMSEENAWASMKRDWLRWNKQGRPE